MRPESGNTQSRGRRRVAALLAGVLLLAGAGLVIARERPEPASTPGSTIAGRFVDRDGNGTLERGPGEPLADRTELAPARRPLRELASFAQLSDAHVPDEESPARLPVLDRFGPPLTSAFRPQEALAAQVLAASVAALNRTGTQAVVATGDLADNAQAGEFDTALAVLDGGPVDPSSGARRYDGLQGAANPDPLIYRPDVDSPRHPGLLAAAQRPFRSPGLRAPWFAVAGNHDLLAQGEVPPTPRIEAVATGDRLLVELDQGAGDALGGDRRPDPALVDRLLARGLPGRTRRVPADPRRRMPAAAETVARLRDAGATPATSRPSSRLDYSFDIGDRVRGIVLDLVNRGGGSRGVVAGAQVAWLRRELDGAGQRHIVVFSHQRIETSLGGEALLAVLDREPKVVAAVAGHTHRNRIAPRRSPAGGYWLVTTASLADHPQQARGFRLVETEGGKVALETWMVDHGPGPGGLAGISRELAFLDVQGGRPSGAAGGRADRNVRLFLPR